MRGYNEQQEAQSLYALNRGVQDMLQGFNALRDLTLDNDTRWNYLDLALKAERLYFSGLYAFSFEETPKQPGFDLLARIPAQPEEADLAERMLETLYPDGSEDAAQRRAGFEQLFAAIKDADLRADLRTRYARLAQFVSSRELLIRLHRLGRAVRRDAQKASDENVVKIFTDPAWRAEIPLFNRGREGKAGNPGWEMDISDLVFTLLPVLMNNWNKPLKNSGTVCIPESFVKKYGIFPNVMAGVMANACETAGEYYTFPGRGGRRLFHLYGDPSDSREAFAQKAHSQFARKDSAPKEKQPEDAAEDLAETALLEKAKDCFDVKWLYRKMALLRIDPEVARKLHAEASQADEAEEAGPTMGDTQPAAAQKRITEKEITKLKQMIVDLKPAMYPYHLENGQYRIRDNGGSSVVLALKQAVRQQPLAEDLKTFLTGKMKRVGKHDFRDLEEEEIRWTLPELDAKILELVNAPEADGKKAAKPDGPVAPIAKFSKEVGYRALRLLLTWYLLNRLEPTNPAQYGGFDVSHAELMKQVRASCGEVYRFLQMYDGSEQHELKFCVEKQGDRLHYSGLWLTQNFQQDETKWSKAPNGLIWTHERFSQLVLSGWKQYASNPGEFNNGNDGRQAFRFEADKHTSGVQRLMFFAAMSFMQEQGIQDACIDPKVPRVTWSDGERSLQEICDWLHAAPRNARQYVSQAQYTCFYIQKGPDEAYTAHL